MPQAHPGSEGHDASRPEPTATPAPRLAPRARHGLGMWWLFIAILGAGLAMLGAGWLTAGGIVMALAFGVAALVRLVRPDAGGLHIRSRAVDVLFYLSAALNVLGAVLLVERLVPLRVVGIADVALLGTVAVVWLRGERAAARTRPS